MEAQPSGRRLYKYCCQICNYPCATRLCLQEHLLSNMHIRAAGAFKSKTNKREHTSVNTDQEEEAATSAGALVCIQAPSASFVDYKKGATLPPGDTLEEMFNACRDIEPAIGLEYIYEYHPDTNGHCAFACRLCNCKAKLDTIFRHVIGAKHRSSYLKKHHPEIIILPDRRTKMQQRLQEAGFLVERLYGRKQTNLSMSTNDPKSLIGEFLCAKCIVLRKEYAPHDPVNEDGSRTKRFLELKEAYEAGLKAAEARGEAAGPTTEYLNFSERDPVEFLYNDELFEYLNSFNGVNDNNVTFIMEVVECLSNYLKRQKSTVQENKASSQMANPSNKNLNNTPEHYPAGRNAPYHYVNTSPEDVNRYQDFLTNFPLKQQLPISSQINMGRPGIEASARVSIGSASNIPQDPWLMDTSYRHLSEASLPQSMQSKPPPPELPDFTLNEATAQFFESLKYLEVSEVISKLKNLSATNPAFRGINISSVIKYLEETGRLNVP